MKKLVLALMIVVLGLSFLPMQVAQAQTGSVPGFPDMYPVEEVTGYLMPDKMPVMVIPLDKDFFYSYYSDYRRTVPAEIRTYEVSGVELGYKNLYLVPDPDNPRGYMRYTILYHTTGTRLEAIAVYDRGQINMFGKYRPTKKYYTSDTRTGPNNPDTEHSVLGDFYPNKIYNDLEAAQSILEYQLVNGPFIAGREYSLIDVLDINHQGDYLVGKTSSGERVPGGGVCVIATDFFKMLTLSGATILEKWEHPNGQKYFENPTGAAELPIDATDATVQPPLYDVRWIQKTTGYVNVTAAVMPDGDKVWSEFGDESVLFDAIEIITLRFTTTKPSLSSSGIEKLQQAYLAYRTGDASTDALLPGASRLISSVPWSRGDAFSLLLAKIVPEERVSRFAYELNNDPFLKSLVEFRQYANSVDSGSVETRMGTYMKTTPWYAHELARLKGDEVQLKQLEQALNHLDAYSNIWPNQKIQCYGFAILIWAMDQQDRFSNIGGIPIGYAADLVPVSIRKNEATVVYENGMRARVVSTLDEVSVGDLGVLISTSVGHVFAVVGKKTIDGETVLLIASSNQASDGKVAIFEVDKSNFDVVFGIPTVRKVVLQKGY